MRVCFSRIECCAVFAWLFSWIYIMCILQHSYCLCAWNYAIFSLFRSWHSTALALLIAPSLLLLVCALWGSKWVCCVWFTACTVREEKPKQKQTGTRDGDDSSVQQVQYAMRWGADSRAFPRVTWGWRFYSYMLEMENTSDARELRIGYASNNHQPTSIVGNVVVVVVVGFVWLCMCIDCASIYTHMHTEAEHGQKLEPMQRASWVWLTNRAVATVPRALMQNFSEALSVFALLINLVCI